MLAGSFSRAHFSVEISPVSGFSGALHSAFESVHMRMLDSSVMFCSIQILASCMAAISSSVELVIGHPFPFKVLMTVGASGLPVVMIAALPPSHRPLFADPSVCVT